jgi:hypothetical protein
MWSVEPLPARRTGPLPAALEGSPCPAPPSDGVQAREVERVPHSQSDEVGFQIVFSIDHLHAS